MLLTLPAERMFPQRLMGGLDMSNRLGGSFRDKLPQAPRVREGRSPSYLPSTPGKSREKRHAGGGVRETAIR
jgi:hypothetical protein